VGLGDAAVGDASGAGEVLAAHLLAFGFGEAFAGEEVAGDAGGSSDDEAQSGDVPRGAEELRDVNCEVRKHGIWVKDSALEWVDGRVGSLCLCTSLLGGGFVAAADFGMTYVLREIMLVR
jgi:hypothetical protein